MYSCPACKEIVDEELNFCTNCGIPLVEGCPYCQEKIVKNAWINIVCKKCKRILKMCTDCSRLYELGQSYCQNNYCAAHKEQKYLNKGILFWKNSRCDYKYNSSTTAVSIPHNESIEIKIDILANEHGQTFDIENSYPLVYGNKLIYFTDTEVVVQKLEGQKSDKGKLKILEPMWSYKSNKPIIARNNLLFYQNKKIINIVLDDLKMSETPLNCQLSSYISINKDDNSIAFGDEEGNIIRGDFKKNEGKFELAAPISIDANGGKVTINPLFIDNKVYFITDNKVLYALDNGEVHKLLNPGASIEDNINCFLNINDEYIMIASNKIMFLYDIRTSDWKLSEFTQGDRIRSLPCCYKRTYFFCSANSIWQGNPDYENFIKLWESNDESSICTEPIVVTDAKNNGHILIGVKNKENKYRICRYDINDGSMKDIVNLENRTPGRYLAFSENRLFVMFKDGIGIIEGLDF